MRFKDADISVPSYFVLNNNQPHRNSFDIDNLDQVKNKIDSTAINEERNSDFQIAEDTSIANTRNNSNFDSDSCNNINNIFPVSKLYQSSSTESLTDFEGSEDPSNETTPSDWSDWSEESNAPPGCRGIVNPNYPGFHHLGPSLLSDTDLTEDELDIQDTLRANNIQDFSDRNEFNNNIKEQPSSENINQLNGHNFEPKIFYDKPKFNIHNLSSLCDAVITPSEKCMNYVRAVEISQTEDVTEPKVNETIEKFTEENNFQLFESALRKCETEDSMVEVEIVELMTSVKETLQFPEIEEISEFSKTVETSEDVDLIREAKELPRQMGASMPNNVEDSANNTDSDSYSDESQNFISKLDEIDLLSSIGRDIGVDLEKYVQPVPDVIAMEPIENRSPRSRFVSALVIGAQKVDTNKLLNEKLPENSITDVKKKEKLVKNQAKRKELTHFGCSDKFTRDVENISGNFDVYNIETAMPKIDLDAIEIHLMAAREEERRRRNDREEIRRRLAMGSDADELKVEKSKKPSLQSRLQNGMNLQICFMNEASSDTETGSIDKENLVNSTSSMMTGQCHEILGRNLIPQVLSLPPLRLDIVPNSAPVDEVDFFTRQTRLQMEAKIALSQAKEMAHMQVEVERQKLKHSPITEMVRSSLAKIGIQLSEERRRLSRILLTELNVAQLQVLANDLHARIATLNENLVEGLLRRDDLHMEQDSMLVDVEDLTRYL